jgi:hypothetical protein
MDPELRRFYRANLTQFIVDLLIWWLIGNLMFGSLDNLAKAKAKEIGNKNFLNASINTGTTLSTSILKMSTTDANFIDSIFSRGKDWTPFAIKSADRLSNNVYRTITGK